MSPAVVVSSSSPSSSKNATKPRRAESAHGQPRARRTRVVRRRGRGRPGMVDSDDEIERETMSDASDSDEPSLIDSASDSEAESESESLVLRNGRHHLDTPSTTQSPPPGEAAAALNGFSSKLEADVVDLSQPPRSAPAFLSAGVDWSDMVTAEGVNGTAPLPIIDFAELHEHAGDEPPHLTNQEDTVASGDEKEKQDDASSHQGTERPQRGNYRGASGSAGHSARQAYQQRLQADPSFVPTVGEFWGHDDRLLQKDLRSLSGWWRGRWQGRGRGFTGRGMRGRGRGGFFVGPGPVPDDRPDTQAEKPNSDEVERHQPGPEVPPVEKTWTHDGFEQMKAKEDQHRGQKRGAKNRPTPSNSVNGATAAPLRGGFAPRGRGSFRGSSSPTPSRGNHFHRLRSQPDRPWFAMKPEHVWTKQFEGFLYSDPSLKPKHGKPAGYRVKLPGKVTEIIRGPAPQKLAEVRTDLRSQPPSEGAPATDAGSRTITVKLPNFSTRKDTSHLEEPATLPEPITTVEDRPGELLTGASIKRPFTLPAASVDGRPSDSQTPAYNDVTATPGLTRDSSFSEKYDADVSGITTQTAQFSLENDIQAPEVVPMVPTAMPPPPIQTSFPPPLQPTPTYSSSPYAYPPSLPPGFALNQQGFAYEIASGRPVYLQPTPPPQMQIFNPRPIPFVPGHMHHHTMSGEFLPGPSTPPINGILDPSTGQPIFALPRQSSRIEIRAPSDSGDGQMRVKQERRPSHLRSVTVAEQNGDVQQQVLSASVPPEFARYPSAPEYYRPDMVGGMAPQPTYQSSEGSTSMSPGNEAPPQGQPPMDAAMMGYPPYQQQYYYPDQYYPAYVEMPQQLGQYDPYNTDPRQPPPMYY